MDKIITGSFSALFLHASSRPQRMSGVTATAIETRKRAISFLPSGHSWRQELEERLAGYEAALAVQITPDSVAP